MPLAKIQNSQGPDKDWHPYFFHRVHPSQVGLTKYAWKSDNSGIHVFGEDKVRRTRGKPITLTRIRDKYRFSIELFSLEDIGLLRLIAATIATESGGRLPADRYEKYINDWSFGLMQTLTNTAWGLNRNLNILPTALKPIPKGGSKAEWKKYLDNPEISIQLGAYYLKQIDKTFKAQGDPVLIYSGYNAGSPRPSTKTPWGLVYYIAPKQKIGALDHFAAWYGDACEVIK